jgi:cell division cycle 20-like protein 1, cofactor of APC complex
MYNQIEHISLCGFQVTKLCDLGPYDGVCSVQWTKEGSFISIGTNGGQVQVPC